ncbi:cytosol aminopeptidase-like [Drosophila persimilis]|uniref:cytosol aminopeptidase-like n=1 Tax=Drosophila persimilis TaxID=7234 RepID=UPI000F079099|nr:cytosol aminopeptidase-like [Drosophila persimilis]
MHWCVCPVREIADAPGPHLSPVPHGTASSPSPTQPSVGRRASVAPAPGQAKADFQHGQWPMDNTVHQSIRWCSSRTLIGRKGFLLEVTLIQSHIYLSTMALQEFMISPATTSPGYPASLDLYARKDEVCDLEGWRIGLQKAAAQNLTRQLQEMPSNLLTPTAFAQNVVEVLCKSGVNVEVKVEGWAESQSMHAFLAVGKASCEPPIFLELSYYGTCAEERPIVLVGQGVTYDAGGLCLKEKHELFHMRGDMTGAAVVVACCRAVAGLRLPVNIRGLIPLCENVVGCNSVRTGDMVKSMNGKTIEIQCTDHEDVLVLADALLYAQNFCPKCIIDVGTCSGYMRQALDESAAGVFTNSEILWQQIKHASMHTGDRVWRFPLWKYYSKAVRAGGRSDVQNYGIDRGGRPCKAAAFLREFVPCGQWMHIDATNVMVTKGFEYEYLRKGMAARPEHWWSLLI